MENSTTHEPKSVVDFENPYQNKTKQNKKIFSSDNASLIHLYTNTMEEVNITMKKKKKKKKEEKICCLVGTGPLLKDCKRRLRP